MKNFGRNPLLALGGTLVTALWLFTSTAQAASPGAAQVKKVVGTATYTDATTGFKGLATGSDGSCIYQGFFCAGNPLGVSSWFYKVMPSLLEGEIDPSSPVVIDEFDNVNADGYWGLIKDPNSSKYVLSYTLTGANPSTLVSTDGGRTRLAFVDYSAQSGIARLIGVAFAAPLAWFWLRNALTPQLKPRLVALLVLGGLQGALGWAMVASGLVDRPSVSHYRLAAHLLLAVAAVVVFLLADLVRVFMNTPTLDAVILGVLVVGIFFVFRQVVILWPEVTWLRRFQHRDEGAAPPPAHSINLLAPMATMLGERQDQIRLSPTATRALLDGIATRLDERRELARYMIGLLIKTVISAPASFSRLSMRCMRTRRSRSSATWSWSSISIASTITRPGSASITPAASRSSPARKCSWPPRPSARATSGSAPASFRCPITIPSRSPRA